MLIVKAPLRISIGGGGTDLPSYYEHFESEFISAAINKYIYVSVHNVFVPEIIVKYSELERVQSALEVRHPIVREALLKTNVHNGLEIVSFADIPAGTGLGSSGTFTVALLKGLYTAQGINHTPMSLAEDACNIEIEKLKSPVGKQDQYIASVGGFTKFHIDRKGKVDCHPMKINSHDMVDLEDHLLLFFTGYSRNANDLLREQDEKSRESQKSQEKPSNEMLENLHFTKELGQKISSALETGRLNEFGRLMNEHWEYKKRRSKKMSSNQIDEWYTLALKNGAIGGKVIGAGGGGFLMFLADDNRRLRKTMREAGMREVPFRFDRLGAQVVLNE